MKINVEKKRVYVCCPANITTGGPELLHQLVAELRDAGVDAFICYYPFSSAASTPIPYLRYGCPVVSNFVDDEHSAIVVPEVSVNILNEVYSAQRLIWWLSVDNYRGNFDTRRLRRIWLKRSFSHGFKRSKGVVHLFQSAYAEDFVKRRFGSAGWRLSDYLADEYLSGQVTDNVRQPVVLYNPKKGYNFTRKIIAAAPHIAFIPLENMSREELKKLMGSAVVYMDFGTHPGKDRLPREAAMSGCVVVVGKRGAALNKEDIQLDARYKFSMRSGARVIVKELDEILNSYAYHFNAQIGYRKSIEDEKGNFASEVRKVFSP